MRLKFSHLKLSYFDSIKAKNIKQAFPPLKDINCVPKYVEKVHAGPFLWVARERHYEYTHYDPDEGCLMVIQGEKEVRLFSNEYLEEFSPNKLGSLGRTIQSQVDLENVSQTDQERLKNVVCHFATLKPNDM